MKILLILMAALSLPPQLGAQTREESAPRASIAAGMGVEYASYPDVADLIAALPSSPVSQFKSGVEFFGSLAFPLTDLWILKFEYAYGLASWSPQGPFGPATFDVATQMPSLILQYVLTDRGVYNVKLGAGGGYHFGSMSEKYLSIDNTYSARGPGFVLEIEANTAFGDHLYAFLGANIRWELIGRLLDDSGGSPGVASGGSPATLHSFGAGARLGACYLF